MDGVELFSKCLAPATVVVKQVRPEHYANATPCADWHVGDLLDHLLGELRVVPKLLAGEKVEATTDEDESGENVVDETDIELSANWQAAADAAEAAGNEVDPDEIIHSARGDVSIDSYLRQVATDLLVHAWDLAVAIGMPLAVAPDVSLAVCNHALSSDRAMPPDDDAAVPLAVDENAAPQTKLLALYGRSPDWRAAG